MAALRPQEQRFAGFDAERAALFSQVKPAFPHEDQLEGVNRPVGLGAAPARDEKSRVACCQRLMQVKNQFAGYIHAKSE